MSRRVRIPEHPSSLRKDFAIFLEPGFLLVQFLMSLLAAGLTAILLYATMYYGIPPF
jgi:hypothetical protein